MGLMQEFKEFAIKGNALDMAIGIILGVAFNNVVQSLVNDIIMPPIGLLIGGVDFEDLAIVLQSEVVNEAGEVVTPAVTIGYGLFLNNVINFFLVAFSAFIIVKVMNRALRKREKEAVA